jgi:DNA-binding response OmpR family regulator
MVTSQATILVVDDDPKHLRLVEVLLRPRGYTVVTAANGAEALEQVHRAQPDLILLDVMMPLVDGFEVCKLLKDHPATRLIPVVMMTALGSVEDRIKGIDAGADDFLTKPVHRDELLARIRTSLRLKRAIDATLDSLRQEVLPPLPEARDAVFRQEGDYWTLAYQGTVCRLKDLKGLHYLACLLARPGEDCHVVALVTAVDRPQVPPATPASHALSADQLATHHLHVNGLGDAGTVLDPQAKAAYQRPRNAHVIAREGVTCLVFAPGVPTAFAGRGVEGQYAVQTVPVYPESLRATTCIDISTYVRQKLAAIAAHRTQCPIIPTMFPEIIVQELFAHEYFIRVVPRMEMETELVPASQLPVCQATMQRSRPGRRSHRHETPPLGSTGYTKNHSGWYTLR